MVRAPGENIVTMFLTKTMQARTVIWQRLLSSRKCQQLQDGVKQQVRTLGGKPVVDNSIVQNVDETSAIGVSCGSSGIHEARQECAF